MTEEKFMDEPQIIKVIGEHNEEIFMKLLEIVNVNEQDYALLSVVEEDKLPGDDDDNDEIVIMKMVKTEDECTFEIIESDEEFNMAVQAITDDEENDDEGE